MRTNRKKKAGILAFLPACCSNWCLVGMAVIVLVMASGMFGNGLTWFGETDTLPTDTTTTDTMTDTTETTTTTTPPGEDNFYKIKFSFLWGDSIADEDKVWVEFAAHDYHDTTPAGKRDQVTLAAGHGDTGEWFYGAWGESFAEGEALTITMESYNTWYDMLEWPDVTVGPWSHSFTFYSYKYGFSAALTSELMITWELI